MKEFALALIIVFSFQAMPDKLLADSFVYDSHGKRDPFLPPAQSAENRVEESAPPGEVIDTRELEEWFGRNLGGIIWDRQTPYALLGDDIVGVGDERKGCTIIEIRPDSIVFQYKTKKVEVPIRESLEEGEGH